MTKREFVIAYVLARAGAVQISLDFRRIHSLTAEALDEWTNMEIAFSTALEDRERANSQ